MKNFIRHLRSYIVRGLLGIMPIALSYFAVKLLYNTIDRRVVGLVDAALGHKCQHMGYPILMAKSAKT